MRIVARVFRPLLAIVLVPSLAAAQRGGHALRQTLRFGGKRADIGLDLYNLFNGNTATGYDNGFGTDGSTWLRPTAVLNPRFVRFNLTVDF